MEIIYCPACGMMVALTSEGECPSCRKRIDPEAITPESQAKGHKQAAANKAFQEQLNRHVAGRRARTNGCLCLFLVPLAFLLGGCVPFPFFIGNVIAAVVVFRHAGRYLVEGRRWLQPDARVILETDKRRPILYLRSFKDDGQFRRHKSWLATPTSAILRLRSTEERLVALLSRIGPVIALRRPGELLPELGAYRMTEAEDSWRDTVHELMTASQLVMIRLAETESLRWELETLVAAVSPEQIVVFVPRSGVTSVLWRVLHVEPDNVPRRVEQFVYFDEHWNPRFEHSLRRVLKRKGLYRPPAAWIVYCVVISTLILIGLLVSHVAG